MGKNIVILTEMGNPDTPFCSFVFNHARALEKQGNNVTAIVVYNFFPFIKKRLKLKNKIIDNINIIYLNTIGFSNILYDSKINLNGLSYYFRIKRLIKKIHKNNPIDLIDAHYFKAEGYAAARISKLLKIKVLVTLHGSSFNKNYLTNNGVQQIKYVGENIHSYVCVSNKIYNQLEKIDVKNKKVIFDGIIPFKVKRNNNNHNICTLGNLVDIKHIDYIISEMIPIAKKYKDFHLYIIGDGPLKSSLMKLSDDLGLSNNISFLGKVTNEEVYSIFSRCNIFALISSPEGFGISYCESMYCGCIAIGTKNEGIDGYIKDGVNGFLIERKNGALSQKIDFIFSNNCDKIRERGIEIAKETTWDKNAIDYMEL